MLLDMETIARITGGTWFNVPDNTAFTGISYSLRYMTEGSTGNLFFALDPKRRNASFQTDIFDATRKAITSGARAVVVPNAVRGLPDDWPLLRVDDVVEALDHLAFHVRDQLFSGKRILVSGSHGSNDFKNLLRHVLSPQMHTHAVATDVDFGFAIVASLASIRKHDRFAVVEASARPPGRLAVRSGYVRPHLAVITDISDTRTPTESSIQDEIDAYADVVSGLIDDGYCLINADIRNFEQLQRTILARKRKPLILFGSAANCLGRLLEKHFSQNQWWVTASIEGQQVSYQLPLIDESAPLLSVAVLLTAYYLGADVVRAASAITDFLPYNINRVLYKIACHGGIADMYSNTRVTSSADLHTFLQVSARLTAPRAQGRKIVVLGATSPIRGPLLPHPATLALWIDEAQADILLLAGACMSTVQHLLLHPERVVRIFSEFGRRHTGSISVQPLHDAVYDLLRHGDLLLIGGDVPELTGLMRMLSQSLSSSARRMPNDQSSPDPTKVDALAIRHPIPFVRDKDGIRSLHFDSAVRQGIMQPDQPYDLLFEYTRHMMGWLLFVDPDSVTERHAMQLGLGAGSLTKACRNRLGMKTTAIELNPEVISLCRAFFSLQQDDNKLQVINDDAARQLRLPQWQGSVDALQIDLYDENVSAPIFDNVTFFADCKAVLTKDGCITFNIVGRASSVQRTLNNMGQIFGRMALWSFARCSNGNTVVIAQHQPSRPSRQALQLRAIEIERRWGLSATEWVDSIESWVA